ncbi:MAG: hypothetical protein ABR529_03480 [Actinomycetota bacterium]
MRYVRSYRNCLPDGRSVGEAMRDDPWVERDVLRPIFERLNRKPRYLLCYIEEGRGSWKSGGAAAVCATEAMLYPRPTLSCALLMRIRPTS